jgi:hypothetical protein
MKRRSFVQALAAIPAAAPLALPQQAPPTPAPTSLNPARGEQPPGRAAAEELPKLEATLPEAVGEAMPRFFTPVELGTLRKLSDILMPATASSPGAVAAQAPEFLDFLIGDSGADRKQLYRAGLDGLNAQARRQFSKAFADLDASQASALLAPLRQPWTYAEPADPVARFLRTAKADVRTATLNSRAASSGRRFAGGGLYWYPLD